MMRALVAVLALMAISVSACGGKPCEKLLKYYCEETKNEQLCTKFTELVNSGMSKEACESSLSAAR